MCMTATIAWADATMKKISMKKTISTIAVMSIRSSWCDCSSAASS